MAADFKVLAITPPAIFADEPRRIAELLSRDIWRVHLRHPEASREELSAILRVLPSDYRCRISLHSHFSLIEEFPEIGQHLNHRCPTPAGAPGCLSRSCHSLAELAQCEGSDYVTLSPIYDSISKPGYRSQFVIDQRLRQALHGHRVMALGGVTPDKFAQLRSEGFAGAAMLGYLWR